MPPGEVSPLIRDVKPENCGDPGPGWNPGCLVGVPPVWLYLNPSRTLPLPANADVALPGVGLFFVVWRPFSLLSSISVDNSSSYSGQGGFGCFICFYMHFFLLIFYSLLAGFFLVESLVHI